MSYLKLLPSAALLAMLAACAPDPAEVGEADAADLILTNARVYTLDWGEPRPDGTPAPDAPH
ncbi:MAG: hypothetical protein KJO56_04590, partial [Gammaproteobacteria bacterium]|nr:hypothetical protein [Gammaproteobacteria bacterium]